MRELQMIIKVMYNKKKRENREIKFLNKQLKD